MNKYEEALIELYDNAISEQTHQEVLKRFLRAKENKELLQELVKRATPMKPTYEEHDYMTYDNGDNIDNQPSMTIEVYKCPSCKQTVGSQFNYCPDCGQLIDWRNRV